MHAHLTGRRGRRPLHATVRWLLGRALLARAIPQPPHNPSGGYGIRPYDKIKFWPRRGQCGGRRKSVKKNAALLHFLAFSLTDHPFGVHRGERLAAHNERRQCAAQTRSCGYSPRWGEHCSLPSFAALNRGPLLATPQSPRPGLPRPGSSETFLLLFWSQKRKA